MSNQPISPPPVPDSPTAQGGGVRRHHTISASSRTAHAGSRTLSDESQQGWNDDEVVDQEWVGFVGAVGDKSNLHRQASLPTRYNRAFGGKQSRQGNLTPRTLNSLSAITAEQAHEAEEEEWEREMRDWRGEDGHAYTAQEIAQHQQVYDAQSQGSSHSPLSPSFPPNVPSPPPAASNIRRHQSLTYGAAGGNVRRVAGAGASGLRRSGTLQATMERHATAASTTPSPPSNEENFPEEEQQDEEYQYAAQKSNAYPQGPGQYTPTSVGRNSPWSLSSNNEWKYSPMAGNGAATLDDVQRALSSLEISGGNYQGFGGAAGGQTALPPRMNQQTGGQPSNVRKADNGSLGGGNGNGNGIGQGGIHQLQRQRSGKLQLQTDIESGKGPISPGVPPIGQQRHRASISSSQGSIGHGQHDERSWDQRERGLVSRTSNSNLQYSANFDASGLPPNPPIPAQFLNQQVGSAARIGVTSPFGQNAQGQVQQTGGQQMPGFINAPIDVPSLIAAKGYNPAAFDCKPAFARFFVIKSYTEDDVHKSLKYEIWSSTDPGNKRLDKAFKETNGRGPIYLFFSVNASGHFCGMAEMLTPVDYSRSSTVWASDKWKGVFKVRWIFVRDIPNANLRHIKLLNTQERKPVTNSRDTQELLPDAGQEMLRIFYTHPARTSLLQDFAYYELQSMQKQPSPGSPPPQNSGIQSPQPQLPAQNQQHPFAMANPYTNLGIPQMGSMMPMQLNSQYTMQSVLRNPSPIPLNSGQGYMGMNSTF